MNNPRKIFKKDKHLKNFTIIDNNIFKSGLSIGAIGVITTILSKPDNWIITKQYFINNHNVKRWDIDKIFTELEESGYIIREKEKPSKENQSGITYRAYEEPIK